MYIYIHDNDLKKADSLQYLFLIFKSYYLAFQGLNIITQEHSTLGFHKDMLFHYH